MPLDLSTIGYTTRPYSFTYDWKDVALYALGIGAERAELPYLYEGTQEGMKVYPSFAVIPAFEVVVDLIGRSGGDMAMVVHGGQTVRTRRPIPPKGTLITPEWPAATNARSFVLLRCLGLLHPFILHYA